MIKYLLYTLFGSYDMFLSFINQYLLMNVLHYVRKCPSIKNLKKGAMERMGYTNSSSHLNRITKK